MDSELAQILIGGMATLGTGIVGYLGGRHKRHASIIQAPALEMEAEAELTEAQGPIIAKLLERIAVLEHRYDAQEASHDRQIRSLRKWSNRKHAEKDAKIASLETELSEARARIRVLEQHEKTEG